MQAISVMDAGMAVWEEGIGASLTKGGRRTDLVTKVPLWGKRVIIPSLFGYGDAADTVFLHELVFRGYFIAGQQLSVFDLAKNILFDFLI